MSSVAYSAVIIAKNEACNIGRCLDSLSGCDDIVVVDDFSEDETATIAAAKGARVICHRFESFAKQRNWVLEHVDLRHPWVLMLDADEMLTPQIRREIAAKLEAVGACTAGFLCCRKTMFLDRWLRHSDGFPVWIMRLVHRDRARFVDSGHGEVPAPSVNGKTERIREPFVHYPFDQGMSHWIARHNLYSSREAELELREPARWTWREILRGTGPERRRSLRNLGRRLPFRPLLRFGYHYFGKRGFLDGRAGLIFSLLMAGYEGMIVLKRREREFRLRD